MDPELRRTLEELHALAKDNHRMLRAIRRDQWFGFIGKIIIWVLVLALPLFLYQHYLEPLIEKFAPASAATTANAFGLPTTADLQKLLKSVSGRP